MTLSRRKLAATAACVLLAIGESQATHAWKGIEQIAGQSPIAVSVEGESRHYFRVTSQTPLLVQIKGPVRLRVISRVEMPEEGAAKLAYGLRITEGKRVLRTQKAETDPSSEARPTGGKGRLGQSRQTIVRLPEGAHALKIVADGERPVLVRLQTSSTPAGKTDTVSLTPVDAPRSVSLKEGEKLIPYYSAMPGKPVKFRVIGPSTLELLSRLDYDQTMRGAQSYRIKVTVGSSKPREIELRTTKALTATWAELSDRVPSKFRRTEFRVSEGTHEILVELLKPTAGSIEVHARIPGMAVGNTE